MTEHGEEHSKDHGDQHTDDNRRAAAPATKPSTPSKPYTRDVHHERKLTPPAPPRSGHLKSLSQVLTRQEAYRDGHLSRKAFASLAILTFITFIGNFTQLQLSRRAADAGG